MATGAPDRYQQQVQPPTRWSLVVDVDLAATTEVTAPIYTVPTGKRLVLGVIKMACSASFIQEARIYKDATIVCTLWFDQLCIAPVGATTADYFEEGEVISMYLNNADSATHNYLGTLLGYLEDM